MHDAAHKLKVSVVVIDGVTIGHPCCGLANCKNPLQNNHDRFCPEHQYLSRVCAITGCSLPVVGGKKTCSLAEHRAVEDVHELRGQARFQLQERLHRAQLAHPTEAIPTDGATAPSELVDDTGIEETYELNSSGQPIPAPAETSGRRGLKARFGRKRTHNEQLFVAPCGMIIARETFYNAEAIYSVIVSKLLLCSFKF